MNQEGCFKGVCSAGSLPPSKAAPWRSIGGVCSWLLWLASCNQQPERTLAETQPPPPALAAPDLAAAPALKTKPVSAERVPLGNIEVRKLACQISTPLLGESDEILKAMEVDLATTLAGLKAQADAMQKCVRGNAAVKLSIETTKLSQPGVPAGKQNLKRTVEKAEVIKSTAGTKNACLVSALVGSFTLFEGSCEMVILFGKPALAEKGAIALLGKDAVVPVAVPSTGPTADSPTFKYLADAKPDNILALIGKPVGGPEVKKFLEPLQSAGLFEDLDLVGNILIHSLGLRIDYQDGQVVNVMFVNMENDAYPGKLPYNLKYPAHGADIIAKLGKPDEVQPFSAMFKFKKYRIQVIFNDDDPAIFAKSEISGLRFIPLAEK